MLQGRITGRLLVAGAVMMVVAGVVGACGKSAGRAGGAMTILQTSFPDFLDPALSYTVDGWEPLSQVYPGLLTFPHKAGAAGAKPVPALAAAMPQVSGDGLTYRLRLRNGLTFSNGRPITASDFKASIERVVASDSQGIGLGYTNILGAKAYSASKKGGINGIAVNDASGQITIKLVKPRGSFTYELAIPFAGIVPKGTPAKNQTQHPPPGAGFYMIGDVRQGRGYTLVRNPRFSPALRSTEVNTGHVNTINVKINGSISAQITQIANDQADFMIDNPTADRAGEVRAKYRDRRYREFPTTSTFYFFMNASVPPFNKLAARQAVNYALDFAALNRVQAGFLEKTHGIVPRQLVGYAPSPDLYQGPNLAKARALIGQAGVRGMKVTVWSDDKEPTPATMAYYADVLNKIGLHATIKTIGADTYFTTVGNRSLKAQTGWANWFEDYPHPADFIDTLLNPSRVVATGNNNFSYNFADKAFAARINAVAQKQLTPQAAKEWAALDRYAQRQAYWAVYATRKQSTFFSTRMDFDNCKGDDWPLATHDWGRFCLK